MNKFLFIILAVFFAFTNVAEASRSVAVSKKFTRAIYDVSLNGGESTSHDLDATVPAGAVITDVWVYINAVFTDSGTGSLAFQCAGTRDLMEYNDPTSLTVNQFYKSARANDQDTGSAATEFVPEAAVFGAAGISSVSSECNVTAVVRGDDGFVPLTAGKATVIIEYFDEVANE